MCFFSPELIYLVKTDEQNSHSLFRKKKRLQNVILFISFHFIFITTFDWFLNKLFQFNIQKKEICVILTRYEMDFLLLCCNKTERIYINFHSLTLFLSVSHKQKSRKNSLTRSLWKRFFFWKFKSLFLNLIWWRIQFNQRFNQPSQNTRMLSISYFISPKIQHSRSSPC